MKKISLKSGNIQNNFRLFRVKVPGEKIQELKDFIMEKMNEYLEENDGKLINVKIMKNNEICCFFVTGSSNDNKNWEQYIQTVVLKDLNIVPVVLELKPLNKGFV